MCIDPQPAFQACDLCGPQARQREELEHAQKQRVGKRALVDTSTHTICCLGLESRRSCTKNTGQGTN
eukprot:CAMPEP_0171870376 /NCGR_PEP_ID=MMETSP0992-20121227/32586_1 /TAXON_ID=483369 /ORGANISM="non described non described, Strain CCMP2098" /LENGTH=66 /DNA_ID=CAMNT_0012494467 /DNA_START=675 /DNA_END=875 /DNA_ORIENTATION=+